MKKNMMRVMAALLSMVMLLAAVPFVSAACAEGCVDETADGLCDVCGEAVSTCDHAVQTAYTANNDGTHRVNTSACACGEKTAVILSGDCEDADGNDRCDLCNGIMPNADGTCDHKVQRYYSPNYDGTHDTETTACDCGKVAATSVPDSCVDGNSDKYCDLCYEKIPEDAIICEHPEYTVVVIANHDGTHVRQAVCVKCNAVLKTAEGNCSGTDVCSVCGAKMPEVSQYIISCPQDGLETSSGSQTMYFTLQGVDTEDVKWTFSVTGSANATLSHNSATGTAPSVTVYADSGHGVAQVTATAVWTGGTAKGTFYISFYSRSSATVYVKDTVTSFTFTNKNVFSQVNKITGDKVNNYSLYSFLTDGCATNVCLYENSRDNANVGAITFTTTGKTGQYEADSYNKYAIARLGGLVFTVVGNGTYKLSYELYETVGKTEMTTSTGTINIVVNSEKAAAAEIVYKTEPGKEVNLKLEDFTNLWKTHAGGAADHVRFAPGGTTGLLYLTTAMRGRVESGYKFMINYEYAEDGTYPLNGVTYMPNPNYESYTEYIDFTMHNKNGKVLAGKLKIIVGDQAAAASGEFSDVAATAWYADSVKFVAENGIMSGTSDTTFSPDTKLSRAMVATVLYRMAGEPAVNGVAAFSDVQNASAWYYKAVCWAAENGIVNGTSDTTFTPDADITRQDLAVMLHRYAKFSKRDVSVGENTNILSYEDAFDVSEYAYAALQWAAGEGIITGSAGKLMPTGTASRAEAATMLARYMK